MTTQINIPRSWEYRTGQTLAEYLASIGETVDEIQGNAHTSSVIIVNTIIGAPLASLMSTIDANFSNAKATYSGTPEGLGA